MAKHQWSYRIEDDEFGPIQEKAFIKQIKRGNVSDATEVCSVTRTSGVWVVAGKVPAIKRKIDRAEAKARVKAKTPPSDY